MRQPNPLLVVQPALSRVGMGARWLSVRHTPLFAMRERAAGHASTGNSDPTFGLVEH